MTETPRLSATWGWTRKGATGFVQLLLLEAVGHQGFSGAVWQPGVDASRCVAICQLPWSWWVTGAAQFLSWHWH